MPGRYDAITDVKGIKVGHWTDPKGATGCTVVVCEAGATPGIDVRGAAPGTYDTDLLRPGYAQPALTAVVLSGGSVFGLSAAVGVTRWCEEQDIGIWFGGRHIPIVSGAVIFDLSIGDEKARPGPDQGYAAAAGATDGPVEQGSVGAGTGATLAKLMGSERRLKGGVGTASEAFGDGAMVGALVVVNAVGDIIDNRDGSILAAPRGVDGAFMDTIAELRKGAGGNPEASNTTLGVVATNVKLSKEQTNHLAAVAHDGFARVIRPVHTSSDGDAIFTMATGELEMPQTKQNALETFTALAIERAIIKAVLAATSLAGVPSVTDWRHGAPA